MNFFLAEIEDGCLSLGHDPERLDTEQVMVELKFMSKEEVQGLNVIYPEYLKDEFWEFSNRVESMKNYNAFKIRER